MQDASPVVGETYNRLLTEMPRMSEAVNSFPDVECQRTALDALLRAFGVPDVSVIPATPAQPALTVVPPAVVTEQVPDAEAEAEAEATGTPTANTKSARKRSGSKRSWEPDRKIEFWPEGVQSFKDFVAEKDPQTNNQKNAVAVFWLEQLAGIKEVGLPQVDAAYKLCGWRESADLNTALRTTASKTHWIDTSNTKAITTTPVGRNLVTHELPIKKDKKPA